MVMVMGDMTATAAVILMMTVITVMTFLDASSHLYKRPCPSVGWLVGWLVGPSVALSSNLMKNGFLQTLNNLDTASYH